MRRGGGADLMPEVDQKQDVASFQSEISDYAVRNKGVTAIKAVVVLLFPLFPTMHFCLFLLLNEQIYFTGQSS